MLKSAASVLLALFLSAAFVHGDDKEAKSKQADSPKQEEKSAAPAAPQSADDIDLPVPLNQDVFGIKIPQTDENGRLTMLFNAEVARKIDPDNISMKNLTIESYSEDGKKFNIELPTSVFNLPSRVLKGDESVTIKREDFEIVGQSVEFQTKTRFARLTGNVKMIIYNTENYLK